MKGQNSLTINQATMQEAIQYWLEHCVLPATDNTTKIISVKANTSSGGSDGFVITFESPND